MRKKIILTNAYLESKQYSTLDFHDKENVLCQLKKEKEELRQRLKIVNLSIEDLEFSKHQVDSIGIRIEQIKLNNCIVN